MAKKIKGATPADKRKMAAEKKRQEAEKLNRMQQMAYDRAYKSALMQAAKRQGKIDAMKSLKNGQ